MIARTLGGDGRVYIREEGDGGFVRLVGDRVRRAVVESRPRRRLRRRRRRR